MVAGLLPGQPGDHRPDRSDLDEIFGVGAAFVVAAQSAAAVSQPDASAVRRGASVGWSFPQMGGDTPANSPTPLRCFLSAIRHTHKAMVYSATVMIMARRLARRSTDPPMKRHP